MNEKKDYNKIALEQRDLVKNDLRKALSEFDNLPGEYKLKRLMQIYDTHLFLNTMPLLINYYDIVNIISNAKSAMADLPGKVVISKKELSSDDIRFVAIMESIIGSLNRLEAYKRLPRIDYTK